MIDVEYYTIDESSARLANDVNSMSDYENGSATAIYRNNVDHVYEIVDKISVKKPDLLERAQAMAVRYSRKLADYYNSYYRNEASCPSVLVSGGSNFPTKKKEKQNVRRENLLKEYNSLKEYERKIENLLYQKQPILSNDEKAIEKLENKLQELEELQNRMKGVNAYYRKNKSLDGCPILTTKEINALKETMASCNYMSDKPFQSYELANNNANIKRTRERLENLRNTKESEIKEKEYDGFILRENIANMRIQFIFNEKPSDSIRTILKENGFRWSPRETAWQRQLTDNGRLAAKKVCERIS